MAKTVNLEKLKEDMERWPRAWAGFGSDIPTGKQIVQAILPFLLAMVEAQLTLRTQRASDRKVKQGNCNRWERREELEYGVTNTHQLQCERCQACIAEHLGFRACRRPFFSSQHQPRFGRRKQKTISLSMCDELHSLLGLTSIDFKAERQISQARAVPLRLARGVAQARR